MEEQIVEILDARNQCWVIAEVLDIDIANAKFMARYGDRPLHQRIEQDIPISRVRVSSARKPADYKEGDDIEVYTELPWKKGLVGWWKAKVLRTKTNYALVRIENGPATYDIIEMKDSFRMATNPIPFNITGLSRSIYQIQELNKKNLKMLETIKMTARCKIVTFFEEDHKIVIIGEDKSMQSSKKVIKEMFNIPSESEKQGEIIQAQVTLTNYLANKLKGKGNYRIGNIKEKYKVEITEKLDAANVIFTITGPKANVEDARQTIQIKEENIKLSQEAVKFMNAMNEYQYRRFFFDRNIVLFNLDEQTDILHIIGSEKAIQSVRETVDKCNSNGKYHKPRH